MTAKPKVLVTSYYDAAVTDPVRVYVISATERDAPEGSDALSWVLLTNLPIKGFAGATEKIQWYSRRWGIEIWHKVLKSGCKVEDCQLEAADRLKRYPLSELRIANTIVYNVADMLEGHRRLNQLAASPRHIVPGHDPLVMRRYAAPGRELEGVAVRLDTEPAA